MKEAQRVSVLRLWSCMWPSEGRPGPALPSGHSKRAGAPERTGEEVLGSGGGHGGQDGVGGAPKPWGQDAESRTREWGERRAGEEPQGGGRLAGGGLGECPGCVCPHAAPGPGSPASPVEAACFRSLSGRCRARHPGFPPSDVPTPSSVPEGLPPSRWERMKRALTLRTPRHPQARPCRPGAPLSPSPGAPPPGHRRSPGPSPSSDSRVPPQALRALPNPLGSRSRPKEADLWRLKPNVPLASRRLRAVPTGGAPTLCPQRASSSDLCSVSKADAPGPAASRRSAAQAQGPLPRAASGNRPQIGAEVGRTGPVSGACPPEDPRAAEASREAGALGSNVKSGRRRDLVTRVSVSNRSQRSWPETLSAGGK